MKLFNIEEAALEREIKVASQQYYESGTSPLTDEEFDAKLQRLKEINPNNPLLSKTGHGYDLDNTKGIKVKHKYGKAGSLNKAYTVEEIPKKLYCEKAQASLKLDGLSIVLYYVNGILDRALTRGNGDVGIDKTDRISLIVPSALYNIRFSGAIRGELIFNEKNWKKFLALHPDAKNPRNSAAGLINADDFDPDEFKLLDFVAYTVVGTDWNKNTPLPDVFYHLEDVDSFLRYVFSHVVPAASVWWSDDDTSVSVLPELLKSLMDEWVSESGYRADGIVLKSNNINIIEHSSYIEYQYDAIAFKFESEKKNTKVVEVEWNMSKSNCLIPTVIVEPVDLAGTTVHRATGYNAQYIRDNRIDKDAVVTITKCGEIIPNIVSIIEPSPDPKIPTRCPVCGESLVWDGVNLVCKNEYCGNARMQDLIIWGKNIAPNDGFKDALIARFLTMTYGENVSISTIMEDKTAYFSTIKGSAQYDMFAKMMNKIKSSEIIPIKSALLALNIPRLGEITCGKLASHSMLVEKIIRDVKQDMLSDDTIAELRTVVGDATTDSIIRNLPKLLRFKYIADRIMYINAEDTRGEVVITGSLSMSRHQFELVLNDLGYTLSNTVKKTTMCLITDDPDSNSSKNRRATELGIPKLTEAEFTEKYL